jgi:RNase P subunit RPR2
MNCPHCAKPIPPPHTAAVTALRRQRRAHGLCGECGREPSVKYRCEACAIRAKVNRALSVEHEEAYQP